MYRLYDSLYLEIVRKKMHKINILGHSSSKKPLNFQQNVRQPYDSSSEKESFKKCL